MSYSRKAYLKYQQFKYFTVYKGSIMNTKINALKSLYELPNASPSAIVRLCLDKVYNQEIGAINAKG